MGGSPYNTYSFKDTSGAFSHPNPAVGSFSFYGNIGEGEFILRMATERTTHNVASDGTVLISYIAGDNGEMEIQVQQTSPLHAFLLNWFNVVKSNADAQNANDWAAAVVSLRQAIDGSSHYLRGVSPSKVPDKTYAAQGGMVTWRLMAGDIQNTTLG